MSLAGTMWRSFLAFDTARFAFCNFFQICFRRWGHNELDDPTFTNPSLYSVINKRGTVPDLYRDQLVEQGVLSKEEAGEVVTTHMARLNEDLKSVDAYKPVRWAPV